MKGYLVTDCDREDIGCGTVVTVTLTLTIIALGDVLVPVRLTPKTIQPFGFSFLGVICGDCRYRDDSLKGNHEAKRELAKRLQPKTHVVGNWNFKKGLGIGWLNPVKNGEAK